MTNFSVNINDQWKDTTPHVNVDDVWFSCRAVYAKADDVWRKVYQRTAEIIPFPTRRLYEGELHDVRISAA